jgi:hypothetical protein
MGDFCVKKKKKEKTLRPGEGANPLFFFFLLSSATDRRLRRASESAFFAKYMKIETDEQ